MPSSIVRFSIPLSLALGLTPLAHAEEAAPPDPDDAAYPAVERFVSVLEQVRQRHPDVDRLSYQRLVNHALEGMLGSLDPFSSFIHPEMARTLEENPKLDPHIPSLGITLGLNDGGCYLSNILPQSSAARANLLPGARLLEFNGHPLPEFPEFVRRLNAPAGTPSRFLVQLPHEPQPREITLVHTTVESRSVTDSRKLPDSSVGYLRLASFLGPCAREVEAALDDLEDQGIQSLILDLRGNPGGDLDQTVRILGLILPPKTRVITTRGRSGPDHEEPRFTPDRQRRERNYPIAVLIDSQSASASELTAGTLQDLKRATVIGETSYGKGSVQQILPAGDGTALRLTIATYHTPSGRTPHRVGIQPDITVTPTGQDREKIALSFRRSSLTAEEAKSLENWSDPVILKALEKLRRP